MDWKTWDLENIDLIIGGSPMSRFFGSRQAIEL